MLRGPRVPAQTTDVAINVVNTGLYKGYGYVPETAAYSVTGPDQALLKFSILDSPGMSIGITAGEAFMRRGGPLGY